MSLQVGELFARLSLNRGEFDSELNQVKNDTGKSFGDMGKDMMKTGGIISAGLTAPIVGFGISSLKVGGDFQQQMNRVRALTGATGSDLTGLENVAKELGRTTQYTTSQAADAMGFLAMAGFDANEIMAAMPNTLQLAAAGQMDLARAADITTNILTGYGIDIADLSKANDVLVKAMTSANVDLEMLGQSFKYVGPVARGAGVEFEDAAAAIALLGNAGIQGSMAGTSLRQAIGAMINPTAKQADIMERLGIVATDSSGKLKPLDQIIEQLAESGATTGDMLGLFGNRAGPAMSALVGQGADALRDLREELYNSGGTAAEISQIQMEGLNGAMLRAKSAWEGFLITVAEAGVMDTFAAILEKVAVKITDLSVWFENLDPKMQMFIFAVAGILAALGPVVAVIGTVIVTITILSGVVLAVVAAIALLLAAAVAIYIWRDEIVGAIKSVIDWAQGKLIAAWEAVKGFLSGVWDSIASTARSVWDSITGAISSAVQSSIDFVVGLWNGLTSTASSIWNGMKDIVVGAVQSAIDFVTGLWNGALGILSGIWNSIKAVFSRVWNSEIGQELQLTLAQWREWITSAWNAIMSLLTGIWNTISSVASTVWAAITSVITAAWDAISAVTSAVTGTISTVISGVWNTISGVTSAVWGTISGAVGRAWTTMRSIASTGTSAVRTVVSTGWNTLRSATSTAWNGIRGAVGTAWTGIRGLTSTGSGATNTITTTAWNAISRATSTAWGAIRVIIEGAWTVIRTVTSVITGAIRTIIVSFLQLLRGDFSGAMTTIRTSWNSFLVGIRSIASTIITSIRTTISSRINDIIGFFRNMPSRIRSAIPNPGGILRGIGVSIINGLWNGMKEKWNDVTGWVGGLGSTIAGLKGPIEEDRKLLLDEGNAIIDGLFNGMQRSWDKHKSMLTSTIPNALHSIGDTQIGSPDFGRGSVGSSIAGMVRGGGRLAIPQAAGVGAGGSSTFNGTANVTQYIQGVTPEEVTQRTKRAIRQVALDWGS